MYEQDLKLLIDGKQTFPEVLKCINNANKSIHINMFIWRDDKIGREIADALLVAANRGVEISISIDKYGAVLEKSEEAKRSLFHKRLTLAEWCKIRALELLYPTPNSPFAKRDDCDDLYRALISHPGIKVSEDVFKADHSKYYVFDDEILIMGGINIEDKENGSDMHGRVYQDYMIKLSGKKYVDALRKKLCLGVDTLENLRFGANTKSPYPVRFEMREKYLKFINEATSSLIIVMAYFSPCKDFIKAIANACARGVDVTLLMPASANFQDDSNKRTMEKLLNATGGKINVYTSPKMLHTKAMISDTALTLGSTNITKKAFKQLSELNIFIDDHESELRLELMKSIEENIAISRKITDASQIKYNKFNALCEGILM